MSRERVVLLVALSVLAGGALSADTVDVRYTGVVEFNQINSGPFAAVQEGDSAVVTFQVDSEVFTDSVNFPTRGYDIDPESFSLVIGPAETVLQDPFPPGETPYFVLRDNDPAVDGFWTSTSIDFPLGLPTDVVGAFGNFILNFQVTYTGETLESLDILDALGIYDFAGLTVFNFTIDDGPFNAMGLIFEELSITAGPSLEVSGSCPGEVVIQVSGATPNSLVTVYSGEEGGHTAIQTGPCAGTRLPIGDPTGRKSLSTNAAGDARFKLDIADPARCLPTLVALDRDTCAVTNTANMP